MAIASRSWAMIDADFVAAMLQAANSKKVLIDSRSLFDYNACHIVDSVNVSCSKLIKRRLQNDAMSVNELLTQNCRVDVDFDCTVIVYDQATSAAQSLTKDSFLGVLLDKLSTNFQTVSLLKGGFCEFRAAYPLLCTSTGMKPTSLGVDTKVHPHHSSLSQPCLPVSNIGPTRILPFLFLGSQLDSLCQETMKQNGIGYVLNVSTSSPKPSFIPEEHFLRIPVNDSYSDKLTPFFRMAFQFLDKVREANGCVLVHCLAGISRSATLAIAYVMRALSMTTDEAYRYVKDKRPTISPNFNFLGQLLEFEKELQRDSDELASCSESLHKKQRVDFNGCSAMRLNYELAGPAPVMNSPTSALSRLNFSHLSPLREFPTPPAEEQPTAAGRTGFPCPSAPNSTEGRATSPGLVIQLGTKHCHGALKRPFTGPEGNAGEEEAFECGRLKRTLARPRSITLPSTMQPAGASQPFLPRTLASPGSTAGVGPVADVAGVTPSFSIQCEESSEKAIGEGCLPQTTPNENIARIKNVAQKMLLSLETSNCEVDQPVPAARKSRSLEDMLTSEVESQRCPSARKSHVSCTVASDMPVYRCHGTPSGEAPHHLGSGLSSAGSHSSLLDSPEIIQVS